MNTRAEIAADNNQDVRKEHRPRTDIATHYLRYSLSNGAVMLLGFISFPILARFLDNAQFGILRYYDTLMLLGVALFKFGAPHAIVRFYPYGNSRGMVDFGTNTVFLPMMLSLGAWAICMVGLMAWSWGSGEGFPPLFWCAAVLVPMLASTNIVQMVIRASERSDILMTSRVIARVLELLLVLGAVILIQQSAVAVYAGKLIGAALLLGWLVHWMYRNVRISRDAVDWEVFRNGLVYGFPLMANELAASVLANLDRVLLKSITGDFAVVGIYSIGYALAMQLNVFINATLSEAFTPVVMRAYETGGSEAVRALKDRVLRPMTYAVVAIIVMLLVAGQDTMVALAGRSKAASGPIFIIVGITVSLFALFAIANYGLQLKKRTMQILVITLIAAALNIGLNFLLIPRMGYMGAAWATVAAYAALCIAQFIVCPRGLAKLPDLRATVIAVVFGSAVVFIAFETQMFGLQAIWARLGAAGLLFVLVYALPVIALDATLRNGLLAMVKRSR